MNISKESSPKVATAQEGGAPRVPRDSDAVKRAHEEALERIERELATASTTFARIGIARVIVALAVIAALGSIAWTTIGNVGWAGVFVGLVVFVALVVKHARVVERQERLEASRALYRRGLARLVGDWDAACQWVDIGAVAPEHPYAFDLDIVGARSLMAALDETVTPWGRRELARLLLGGEHHSVRDIVGRQDAIRDLAARVAFRETWFSEGRCLELPEKRIQAFVRWASEDNALVSSMGVRVVAKVVPLATISLFVAYQLGAIPWWWAATSLAAGILVSLGHHRSLQPIILGAVALGACRSLLRCAESQTFTAPMLVELSNGLSSEGKRASERLDALSRITGFLEASNHAVFRIFIAPIFLWDLNGAIALDRWRARVGRVHAGGAISGWPRLLGVLDALSALAVFSYENPTFAVPVIESRPVFEAEGLGHPMLAPSARVTNDLALSERGRAFLITGSNMSGKSTLLRAVGVNAVLAFAGAPVCADALSIGPMQLGTSMRVQDSLADGYSHFYAELRRLKQITDLAASGPLLFLLDEILHGTNARERILGAKAVVRELLSRGALGLVSTHDTQIGALEEESGGRVCNVHFMETVEGDAMRFDYRLRPGVVKSGNALRLMKALGLRVDVPAEEADVGPLRSS